MYLYLISCLFTFCLNLGMARVIPVPLLSLFTGFELETMVCGSPDIPLHLLKSVATYKGVIIQFHQIFLKKLCIYIVNF